MTPRARRIGSGTRFHILGRHAVEIGAQTLQVDAGCSLEHCDGSIGIDEAVATKRSEFTNGNAVARHDVGLAGIQTSHDLPTVVAELALCNFSIHHSNVARCATARTSGLGFRDCDTPHRLRRGSDPRAFRRDPEDSCSSHGTCCLHVPQSLGARCGKLQPSLPTPRKQSIVAADEGEDCRHQRDDGDDPESYPRHEESVELWMEERALPFRQTEPMEFGGGVLIEG